MMKIASGTKARSATPLRSSTRTASRASAKRPQHLALLVGTRKGAFIFHGDSGRIDLDRQFPGVRFRVVDEQDRIRPHIAFFVSGIKADDLDHPVGPGDEVFVVASLSGG